MADAWPSPCCREVAARFQWSGPYPCEIQRSACLCIPGGQRVAFECLEGCRHGLCCPILLVPRSTLRLPGSEFGHRFWLVQDRTFSLSIAEFRQSPARPDGQEEPSIGNSPVSDRLACQGRQVLLQRFGGVKGGVASLLHVGYTHPDGTA